MRRLARGCALRAIGGLLLLGGAEQMQGLGTGKPLAQYGQQAWQSDTGLPQNSVRAVVQAHDGYLWIGTEAGLVRYDGVDFRVFDASNTPALKSNFITGLSEDAGGGLWISTPGGLVRERGGDFQAFGIADGLPSATVLRCFVSRDQRVVVLTAAGVAALHRGASGDRFQLLEGTERLGLTEGASLVAEDGRGRVWVAGPASVMALESGSRSMAAPAAGVMQAMAFSSDGTLWVGGTRGLARLAATGGIEMRASVGLPTQEVTALLAAGDGGMWIGTGKGLALEERGAVRVLPELAAERIERLFMDREGTVWVATGDGVARVTNGVVDVAPRKAQLGGVLCMEEDREGSMWFGSDTSGLHVLREQAFFTVTEEDGLSASLVRAVFEDHAGTLWMGTSGGGLDGLRGGKVEPFAGKLPSKVVLALAETGGAGKKYELWVGTPEGLARRRGGETRVFTTADGLADDFVRSLYADRDGSLWIGTRHGLTHYRDGVFRSFSRLDGLAGDLVGAVLRTRAGELYVGTLGGLSRMTGDGFVDALPPDARGMEAVTALLEDGAGRLWMGSNGAGLSCLCGGRLLRFASVAAMPATIYGMLEDGNGQLWLSSRKGVDRVGEAALLGGGGGVVHYGAADGMRISEASGGGHPAAWRARDGGLWFATLNGAAVVHPSEGLRNTVAPLTVVEQVAIDEQAVGWDGVGAVRVPAGLGRLTIQYAGLSFVAPAKVRYRYMLKGFDKGWVEAGGRRTAFYTNVPPGGYRFLVMSANGDGVWSVAPAEVSFKVEPYVYQTGWFYALVALLLAGMGYGAYRWRVLTVQAQYQAVLAERGRIAREIHDTLAQGYVAISVQLELAERLLGHSTEAAVEQLRQTKQLVRESLAEARSSIWNLRAQSDAGTLPSQLATYCAARQREGAVLKFAVHGTYRPLARSVEEEVQRIAQEAVANALAHAEAQGIAVTLSYGAHLLELRVVDDGVGLGERAVERVDSSNRGHFGMQGMRERAARIGAVLEVSSGAGSRPGTTVVLQVDVRRAARKGQV